MDRAAGDPASQAFLESLEVGDLCGGTVAEVTRRRDVVVTLDGFPARPLGIVRHCDVSWGHRTDAVAGVGQRIDVRVIAVDLDEGLARLSMTATENSELWTFLDSLRRGETLSGTVAAIERFGVFVALDRGPDHPVFPGVGFITIPELSWGRIDAVSDVVQVGQRVSCEFLQFDDWHGEARLSLRALQPDPFQAFADSVAVGQTVQGLVTKVLPFGVFVRVADGVEGLVHVRELAETPVEAPEDVVRIGDELTVVVTAIDGERRRLILSCRGAGPGPR